MSISLHHPPAIIPSVETVRRELVRHQEETRLLRRLLRLAIDATTHGVPVADEPAAGPPSPRRSA